jgi:hypothetical protein
LLLLLELILLLVLLALLIVLISSWWLNVWCVDTQDRIGFKRWFKLACLCRKRSGRYALCLVWLWWWLRTKKSLVCY